MAKPLKAEHLVYICFCSACYITSVYELTMYVFINSYIACALCCFQVGGFEMPVGGWIRVGGG